MLVCRLQSYKVYGKWLEVVNRQSSLYVSQSVHHFQPYRIYQNLTAVIDDHYYLQF